MPDEIVHHVSVKLAGGYRFVASFDGLPLAAPIVLDEPLPLGESTAPNAVALLAAAIGNCLAASLLFCLRKSRVEVSGLDAHVTARVARTETGRMRVAGVDVSLRPGTVTGDSLARLERCKDLFEDFCVVTQSVRQGVPVTVSVDAPDGALA